MRAPSARVRPRPPAAKQVAANGPTAEAAAHATGRASERASDHIKAPLWRAPKRRGSARGPCHAPALILSLLRPENSRVLNVTLQARAVLSRVRMRSLSERDSAVRESSKAPNSTKSLVLPPPPLLLLPATTTVVRQTALNYAHSPSLSLSPLQHCGGGDATTASRRSSVRPSASAVAEGADSLEFLLVYYHSLRRRRPLEMAAAVAEEEDGEGGRRRRGRRQTHCIQE